MTLLVFNSALVVIPISLGRLLFNAVPFLPITHGIKCNGGLTDNQFSLSFDVFIDRKIKLLTFVSDLYAFVIGSYVIWTVVAGARYSIEYIKTRRAAVLLKHIWKWCGIVLKSSVLLSIWVRIWS